MIVDSPYDARELIMRPLTGALIGVAAAGVMVALLGALHGWQAVSLWLVDLGKLPLPRAAETAVELTMVGLVVHLAVGALLGALYAACQQQAPVSGLLVVGAFYGLVLWIGGALIVGRWLDVSPPLLEEWSGLAVIITYGVILAAGSVWAERRSAELDRSVKPID